MVLVHHQVAGGQVGKGTELLTVGGAAALGGGEEALLSIKKRIEQNLRDLSSTDDFISLFDARVENTVVSKTAEQICRIFNSLK